MKTKIKVWVREVPICNQVFWCVAMVVAITIVVSIGIALWHFGAVGAFILGFMFCRLLRG